MSWVLLVASLFCHLSYITVDSWILTSLGVLTLAGVLDSPRKFKRKTLACAEIVGRFLDEVIQKSTSSMPSTPEELKQLFKQKLVQKCS